MTEHYPVPEEAKEDAASYWEAKWCILNRSHNALIQELSKTMAKLAAAKKQNFKLRKEIERLSKNGD